MSSDALGSSTQAAAMNKATIKQEEVASAENDFVQSDAVAQSLAGDISSTKSQISQQQAVIDSPPTIPVTESSKKGSTTTHEVDENAVKAAEQQKAQLEADLATMEADFNNAKSEVSTSEQDMLSAQTENEEVNTKLSTIGESEEILTKLLDVYEGNDGFRNAQEEEVKLERLDELVGEISEFGDIDGSGSDDGAEYADMVDAFLNGDNGYNETAKNREYEGDYIARGEVPPWKQGAEAGAEA